MYCVYMLSAERLCELPLDIRILVARMDIEAYTRMYLWDTRFREYANKEYAVDDFIARFVITYRYSCKIYRLGNIEYYKYDNGKQCWFMNGNYHKTDGPAVILSGSEQQWYINGERHRIDGPAVIYSGGYKAYYQHGKRHRLNGPARIYSDGIEEYYEYGVWIR